MEITISYTITLSLLIISLPLFLPPSFLFSVSRIKDSPGVESKERAECIEKYVRVRCWGIQNRGFRSRKALTVAIT